MIVTTKAIVLSALKYGDTDLILKCYTEVEGLKSYMLRGVLKSKKGKLKPAYFQPLNQLEIVANHNTKGALNSIKDVAVAHHYTSIYKDIKKQTIVLFLSEMLVNVIKEKEQNTNLYSYLETALIWLDTHNHATNFHLLFLLNLTKFIGFYPEKPLKNSLYFDLLEGKFTNSKPKNYHIKNNTLFQFKKLFGIAFDALETIKYSAFDRQEILTILIQYFELHLSNLRKPKSLDILKTIYS